MSWQNETKEEIKLTSPENNIFYGLYRRNEKHFEKKLGIFSIPKFKGDIVQDLGVTSTYYPLTIYFDGMYHHKDAKEFYESLTNEYGQWAVIHPIDGFLSLQLISYREPLDGIDENYTAVETEWILPANITRIISLDELASSILSSVITMIQDALVMLQQLRTDIYSAVQSAINILNKVAGFMDSIISEIAATQALIQELYQSARAAFNNAIDIFSISDPDTDPVGEALVDLAVAPIEASTDFSQRFSAYSDLIDEAITLTPDDTDIDAYNAVVSQEFGLATALIAIARIVVSSEFKSRSEVVSAMENITTILNTAINAMEEAQDNFSDLDIDFQYFSQTKTYTSIINTYSLLLQFLIQQFYNLKAEKRFTIKKARSPLEIAITEYGELGEDDYYYNLFLDSNELTGFDIELLPAGREVIVYVE